MRRLQHGALVTNDHETIVRDATAQRDRARWLGDASKRHLHDHVREAHADGATVPELMSWTGYSRRRIYQLLTENTR